MNIIRCHRSSPISRYNLHAHDEWEIVCQLEGEVRTQIGNESFTACPGDILIIPPHVPHKGIANAPFRDLALRAAAMDFPSLCVLRDYRGDITALISIIERLVTEREGDYQSVADSLAESVHRLIRHEIGIASGSPAVEQLKKLLYENLANTEFKLADHISATGFDPDHFRRRFKAETGKTPTQYLTSLRLVHAKQLLADPKQYPIDTVAHSCGFSDPFYFSTCFKKHIGISPIAYRKKISE